MGLRCLLAPEHRSRVVGTITVLASELCFSEGGLGLESAARHTDTCSKLPVVSRVWALSGERR